MPNYDTETSEYLVSMVAQGDRNAFSCLMSRHKNSVFSFAYRMLGNYEEAEDVSQEVFLTVWNQASTYRSNAKPGTWILAITANMCKNRLRSIWRRRAVVSTGVLEEQVASDSSRPDAIAMKKEQDKRLNTAIQSLTINQRTAISLWRHENMSYQEIATIMDCSVPKLETLLFRAKKRLIALLDNNT